MVLICFVVVIKQQTTVTDKVKHRLEQLDDFEEVIDLTLKIAGIHTGIFPYRKLLFFRVWRIHI